MHGVTKREVQKAKHQGCRLSQTRAGFYQKETTMRLPTIEVMDKTFRINEELDELIKSMVEYTKFSEAEVLRRALKQWSKFNTVVTSNSNDDDYKGNIVKKFRCPINLIPSTDNELRFAITLMLKRIDLTPERLKIEKQDMKYKAEVDEIMKGRK